VQQLYLKKLKSVPKTGHIITYSHERRLRTADYYLHMSVIFDLSD